MKLINKDQIKRYSQKSAIGDNFIYRNTALLNSSMLRTVNQKRNRIQKKEIFMLQLKIKLLAFIFAKSDKNCKRKKKYQDLSQKTN